MKTLMVPLVTLSFYKFINKKDISIYFLRDITGEDIIAIKDINYKYRENLKIIVTNSKNESILIKITNGIGDYRANRMKFKESFLDYSWQEDETSYNKMYNVGIMGFSITDNEPDVASEVVIGKNIYYLKSKSKSIESEEYYISIELPKYEKDIATNIGKWIYLLKDIWRFEEVYTEDDIFRKAIDVFYLENLTYDENQRYENNLAGYRDARGRLKYQLEECYKKSLSEKEYYRLLEIARLLKTKGLSVNEMGELINLPNEILIDNI